MNERERAVCARIKVFREALEWDQSDFTKSIGIRKKWTQADFSKAIGISKSKLVCIEYGHTPLRYKIGVDLCWVFDVNASWLVTGNGEMHGGAPGLWISEFPLENHATQLFTEVYDRNPRLFVHTTRIFGLQEGPTAGFEPEKYLLKKTSRWFERVKFKTRLEAEHFARAINDFAEQKLQALQRSGVAIPKIISREITKHNIGGIHPARQVPNEGEIKCKSMLDTLNPLLQSGGVQNDIRNLKGLIARLKRVTAPRGAKAALAREFKVTRQAVNQWLSGESNPSADIAIRLQYWKPKLPEKKMLASASNSGQRRQEVKTGYENKSSPFEP
jgi:DNA-binding XRE family transcriptional regulator